MQTNISKKYRLLIETAILVALVIGTKLLVEHFLLEFINMNPLFTKVDPIVKTVN